MNLIKKLKETDKQRLSKYKMNEETKRAYDKMFQEVSSESSIVQRNRTSYIESIA